MDEEGQCDGRLSGIEWLREELGLPARGDPDGAPGSSFRATPVFLGHGVEDERVSVILGQNAAASLEALGAETVRWK